MPSAIQETDEFVTALLREIESKRDSMMATIAMMPTSVLEFTDKPHVLAKLANTCLWTSVSQYEGRSIRGAICVTSHGHTQRNRKFRAAVPVTVASLRTLLTASPKHALGVDVQGDDLVVWGICEQLPPLPCVIRLLGPGILAASLGPQLVSVVERDARLSPANAHSLTWPSVVASAVGSARGIDALQLGLRFQRVVAAMHRTGHGGTLVVVPTNESSWEAHLKIPNRFDDDGAALLVELIDRAKAAQQESYEIQRKMLLGWKDDGTPGHAWLKNQAADILSRAVLAALESLADLAAIDGALVVSGELRVHGFGAKLLGSEEDFPVTNFNALTGSIEQVQLEGLGGTRHQSAARFVRAHNNTAVFVSSHDGALSLFTWVEKEQSVIALRKLEYLVNLAD